MCSKECRSSSRKATYPVKACAVCLCDWQPTTPQNNLNKTCSKECLKASRRKKFVKTCSLCLKEWYPENSAKNQLSTCSKECSLAARRMAFANKVKVPKVFPQKQCTVCLKDWQPQNRYQSAKNITCSKKCANVLISRGKKGQKAHNNTRITVTCPVCGTDFERAQSHTLRVSIPTCSSKCNGYYRGQQWGTYGHLGSKARSAESYLRSSVKMTGDKNPAWKGGVTFKRNKGNYIGPKYVRCPPEWIGMSRKDGYIMEHRLVMAQWVGRILTRTEVVNHINHNTRDNRRENLELYPTNGDHKRGEVGRFVSGVHNKWVPPSTYSRPDSSTSLEGS